MMCIGKQQSSNQLYKNEMSASVLDSYGEAIRETELTIGWYIRKRKQKKMLSRTIRVVTLIAFTIGTVCPLFAASGFSFQSLGNSGLGFSQLGYISFALAAAFIGGDKYFGVSSGWKRFMLTQLELDQALTKFKLDWMLINDKNDIFNAKDFHVLIEELKKFTSKIKGIVFAETLDWAAEFDKNFKSLESSVCSKKK